MGPTSTPLVGRRRMTMRRDTWEWGRGHGGNGRLRLETQGKQSGCG